MIIALLVILSFCSYTFAGEPIGRVAQQKKTSTLANVRAALGNSFTKQQCDTCVWGTALIVSSTALVAGSVAVALLHFSIKYSLDECLEYFNSQETCPADVLTECKWYIDHVQAPTSQIITLNHTN